MGNHTGNAAIRTARWLVSCALLLLALGSVPAGAAVRAGDGATAYEYSSIGDITAVPPGETSPGLLLMGGGREIDEAFRWFASQAGHGHIVILGASAPDAMQELRDYVYQHVGGVASVQTLLFHSRAAARDPRVLAIVQHANGIFIKGGDQALYVRFWKGTPFGDALNAHVRAGKPIGGTSAGLAVLGQWSYGAMDGGSITSSAALADPDGPAVTLVGDFLSIPLLKGIITDTHFAQRDRLGRLLAFVARLARDRHTAAVTGLAVDQDSALMVDAKGTARFVSWHADGHAWIVIPQKLRDIEAANGQRALEHYLSGRVVPGKPLELAGYLVIGAGSGSRVQLPACKVTDPAFTMQVDVTDGRLVRHVLQGSVPVQ